MQKGWPTGSAPALEESDVELARDFLTALSEFIRLLRPLPGKSADRLRDDIVSTARRPSMAADFEGLHESYSRMSRYNELLTSRYREVSSGKPPRSRHWLVQRGAGV
jgi:hypothetical protein